MRADKLWEKPCYIVLQKSETWLNFFSVFEVSRNTLHWQTTCYFSGRLVCTMKTVTLGSSLIHFSFKHKFPELWNHYTTWYYKLLCIVLEFDKTSSHLVPETTCPDQSSKWVIYQAKILNRVMICCISLFYIILNWISFQPWWLQKTSYLKM